MIGSNIHKESPMQGPVFQNALSLVISNKQHEGEISIRSPSLVVSSDTRGFVQFSKSTRQSANEWTACLGVMNDTDDRWLGKGAIHVHHISFEPAGCQAKHRELKIWMLGGQ